MYRYSGYLLYRKQLCVYRFAAFGRFFRERLSTSMINLFLLLLIKHSLIDLWLQSYHRGSRKDLYWGGHRHYAEHAAGTLAVCAVFVDPLGAVAAALFDWLCHWHIDHTKTLCVRNWSRSQPRYWFAQSIDQILHYLTYWAVAVVLLG